MIHKLMKKMFMQLIGEFKRLGSTIVYADFNKIVVCTKKKRMEDACAYIKFILRTIKSRELFHSLNLEPTMSWEYLMWMDQVGQREGGRGRVSWGVGGVELGGGLEFFYIFPLAGKLWRHSC